MIKDIVFNLLYYSGILGMLRFLNRDKAIILVYHGVSKEAIDEALKNSAYVQLELKRFKQQAEYLKKKYNIISLERLCRIINSGMRLPPYSVAITFDDGYRNVFENAYTVLRQYRLPCSVFLTSRLMQNNDWLWLDKLEYIVGASGVEKIDILSGEHILKDKRSKRKFLSFIRNELKKVDEERRNKIISELVIKLAVNVPKEAPDEYRLMDYGQARLMDPGLVSFGAHTPEHTILTLESREKARRMILDSKLEISRQLGREVCLFSYPNGSYNDSIKEMLRQNGFLCGLTTLSGINAKGADLFALKRISVSSEDSLIYFIANLSGIRKYTSRLAQFLRPICH